MNEWRDFSETASIATIEEIIPAQLSGDVCGDMGVFFVKQQKWTLDGFEVLKTEAIDEAKSNIHLALDKLDGFLSGSENMNVHHLAVYINISGTLDVKKGT
ncbi:hypothetical protein EDD18DRAFT_1111268 [Armillaria luteobubalina]|uniref:Uncharacterized protein n=1 Tax=Armillaria luteobubalina TaxID=153913 RepID=A0AA39PJS7_9AGAR|nr:hypothetical protein EDD18DRAFT_1111268 [Armillaria luteobubalina]